MSKQQLNNASVEQLSKVKKEPAWLLTKRKEAFALFERLPMPDFKYGLSTKLHLDLDMDVLPFSQIFEKAITSKVVDQQKLEILDLWEAIKKYPQWMQEKLFSCFQPQEKFALLHAALLNHGTFVRVPKNMQITIPVQIVSQLHGDLAFDHLLIHAEPNSTVTIIEKVESPTKEGVGFRSKVVEIFADEGSQVSYCSIQDVGRQVMDFTQKKTSVGNNATVNWMECIFGSKITQSMVTSFLEGEGAKSNNWGIFFGNGEQQYDLAASVIHNARNTVSDMLTKGVLDGKAKAIYRGLIHIMRDAPQSNGYQKADTLMLTDTAEADNIPSLQIDNSDVRCTHGSTIGQVDKEQLFYLMARGLPERIAMKEIVRGFFYPMIEEKIQVPVLQEYLKTIIGERLQ